MYDGTFILMITTTNHLIYNEFRVTLIRNITNKVRFLMFMIFHHGSVRGQIWADFNDGTLKNVIECNQKSSQI
jgi:hypothetical protein